MFTLFALLLSVAQAQVFEGPIGAALAGSGRAGLNANEGSYYNPALVALRSQSEFAGYYKDGNATNAEHREAWGASLSEDSEDVLFPGQLSYLRTRNFGLTDAPVNSEIWHFAFGKLFFKRLAIGASFYLMNQRVENQPLVQQNNGALGGVFLITPDIGVAYVFENPVHASGSVPSGIRLNEQQSIGAYWSTPYYARLRLDLVDPLENNPGNRIDVHGSIESAFAEFFIFRLGGRFDEWEGQRFLTAGLAFAGPELKIDYAIEKNLVGTGGAVHSVDLRMTF